MEVDKRLSAILNEVDNCKTLADVGCDHGITCLTALKYGKANRVIATDISEPSLKKAKNLLTENGYAHLAEFRCGNGLSVLQEREADTIVISGMGGKEIVSILSAQKLDATLVLSPQSEVEQVRRWLVDNGYCVLTDKTVECANKFYFVIKAKKGTCVYTENEFKYGKNNLQELSQDFLKWIVFEQKRIERIIKNSDSENTQKKFREYFLELESIKTYV